MSYRTAPLSTSKMPPGIPYIIGNEAAERFSFYGMRAILTLFMTKHLLDAAGRPDHMTSEQSAGWLHLFVWAVYLTPVLGAILADRWLGKYKTIIWLSIVYCFGHLALALDETRLGLAIGLSLIAIGAGGIKGCVTAHVGDQFGRSNAALLPRVYSWFYFSINTGSFVASLLTPWLLKKYGPQVAFGTPGVLMLLATFVFWLGRRDYAHIPPRGPAFWKETFTSDGIAAVKRMTGIFVFIMVFWSLFDQTASRWVSQGGHMRPLVFSGMELNASQFQAANPIFVLLLIPFCSLVLYPAINKFFPLNPLRKIGIGLLIAVLPFLILAWIDTRLAAGERPSLAWQLPAYFLITLAEVMISITALEFSYTQAPKSAKSLMLGLNFLSVSLGNLFTALINLFGTKQLQGASYYLFFSGLMALAAVVYIPVARRFQIRNVFHDEAPAEPPSPANSPAPAA